MPGGLIGSDDRRVHSARHAGEPSKVEFDWAIANVLGHRVIKPVRVSMVTGAQFWTEGTRC
jgi:hypothetical protein